MSKNNNDISIQSEQIASIEVICHNLLQANLHVNKEARILSLLHDQPPSILAQQQFTKNEWALLIVLFRSYPHYAPYEVLLSSITSLSVDECRMRVQETRLLGPEEVKRELKPIYRALCSLRAKLIKLHPDLRVTLVRDAGYLLTAPPQEERIL